MSEKTKQPTAKRLQDARKEGQVAKSQEINAVVQLGLILLWLVVEGAALQAALADVLTKAVAVINLPLDSALAQMSDVFVALGVRFVLGVAAMLVTALTLTGLMQSGFLFAPQVLQPSLERISPISHIRQMVSMRSLFEFCKTLFKVAVLGLTFAYLIERYAGSFAYLPSAGLRAGLSVCVQMVQWMWSILLGTTIVFAVADYAMQHRQLRKQLMMSEEDIKQETKNTDGDPEIKERRRKLHREVQSDFLAGKVADSTVVVRNPKHIAVCLRYQDGETPLPQVLEIGKDAMALHIVALAVEKKIPMVEDVPLARALLSSTQPGDYIPRPLFFAVAQVLRMVRDRLDEEVDNVVD